MNSNEIYIYGGGVVGYCLAAHFEQLNIPYKIFVKKEQENGYGLTIQEADNILHYLNLKPELKNINYLNRYVQINSNEEIISSNCHSKGNYVISRCDLINLFKSKVKQTNVILIQNEITDLVELEDKVTFKIGEKEFNCSYLIGCDGIHSKVRKLIGIKDEEILTDTLYDITFYNIAKTSIYKSIISDVVELVLNCNYNYINSNIRIFIKPNGPHGATAQVVHHRDINLSFILDSRNFGKHLDIRS